jgi:hypothetical protein
MRETQTTHRRQISNRTMERCKDKTSQIKETTMMVDTSDPIQRTYHRNDTTLTNIKQRGKEHISTSQSNSNIASSDYRIFAMV